MGILKVESLKFFWFSIASRLNEGTFAALNFTLFTFKI